jgi:hypothetical protein
MFFLRATWTGQWTSSALISRAGQSLDTPHGFIHLVNPESMVLECRVRTGIFESVIGATLKVGQGLSGKVWESGQKMLLNCCDFGIKLKRATMPIFFAARPTA